MQNNVYECINISNVINKLHLRKTNRIGNYIYVTCPFCQSSQEKNGYMKVNTKIIYIYATIVNLVGLLLNYMQK